MPYLLCCDLIYTVTRPSSVQRRESTRPCKNGGSARCGPIAGLSAKTGSLVANLDSGCGMKQITNEQIGLYRGPELLQLDQDDQTPSILAFVRRD